MATSKLSRIWKSPFDKEIDGLSLRRNYYSKIWTNSHSLYHKDLLAHHGCVNAVEFSDDGIFMASGGDDKRVFLWRTADILNGARSWPASSQAVPRIMDAEHSSNVFCLSVPLNGTLIFSGGNDQKVIEHNSESGAPQDYYLHEGSVFSIAFQPGSEKVFVTACDDGQLQLFDRNNPSSPIPLVSNRSPFYSVVFHPTDSQMLASANAKDGVNLWDIRHLKKSLMNYPSERGAMSVRFDSSGRRLLVLGRRQDPVVYDIYNSNINKIRLCHPGYLNACTMKTCSFAGDNDEFAVSGSDDHCIYVWKVPLEGDADETVVESAHFVLKSHRSVVNNVRYCPSAGLLASCGVEKMVKIWSAVPLPNSSGGLDRASSELHEPRIPHAFRLPHLLANETFTTEEDTAMLTFFDMLVERSRMASSSDSSSPEEEPSSDDEISSSVLGILLHGVMPRSVMSSSSSSSENSDSDDSNSNQEEALLSLLLHQFLPRRSEDDSSQSSSSSSSDELNEISSEDEEPKAGPSESNNEEEEEPEKLELPPNLFSPTTSGNRRPSVNLIIPSTSNEIPDEEEDQEEHVPFTAGRSKKNRQLRKRKLSSSSSSSN